MMWRAFGHRHFGARLLRRALAASAPGAEAKNRVVIVGSGWAGFRLATDLDKSRFHVDVVSPRNHFLFTPLLPSTAVGTLEFRAIQEPVRTIPHCAYQQANVESIDFAGKTVLCRDALDFEGGHSFTLPYDVLVLATGSETATYGTPGIAHRAPDAPSSQPTSHVYFLKQLQHSRAIRDRLIECFEIASSPGTTEAARKQLLTFVVVGGGPTNVEFASELFDFLENDVRRLYPELFRVAQVKLVEAGEHILGSFHVSLVGYVERLLKTRHIDVLTCRAVKRVSGDVAFLDNGQEIPFGLLVWSAGIKQVPLIEALPPQLVARHKNGRLMTNGHLMLLKPRTAAAAGAGAVVAAGAAAAGAAAAEEDVVEGVFGVGDCAAHASKPLPALAQVASQQAKHLATALNAGTVGKRPFAYQHLGSMMSVGAWKGVYDGHNVGSDRLHVDAPPLQGFLAFALWRAAYWTRQVSATNKLLILMYWFKSAVFGRDVSRF